MVLRPVTDADVPALAAILAEPSVRRWWRDEDPAGLVEEEHALVVEVDGTVVGYVLSTPEEEPDYRFVAFDLFLATAHQGAGLGPRVLREVMARWEAEGHHRFQIDPTADNVQAIRAYAKVGFEPVGVLRAHERQLDGTWADGLLMDRIVDAAITRSA